jgi:hypothetical protein
MTKKAKFYDGRCEESCDLCKASCAGELRRCDRGINHSPSGHICVAHSDEAREVAAEAWRRQRRIEVKLVQEFFENNPCVMIEVPDHMCAELLALVYPNYPARPRLSMPFR